MVGAGRDLHATLECGVDEHHEAYAEILNLIHIDQVSVLEAEPAFIVPDFQLLTADFGLLAAAAVEKDVTGFLVENALDQARAQVAGEREGRDAQNALL